MISEVAGKMTGLKLSECAQMGVKMIPSTPVLTSGPPAAKLYAVEPVGVDIRIPSAWTVVNSYPSISQLSRHRLAVAPLSIVISLSTCSPSSFSSSSYSPSIRQELSFLSLRLAVPSRS